MRPHAKIRIESRHCTWVAGSWGIRDELVKLDYRQRLPVWNSRQRAFCVSEQTARRLLAALETHEPETPLPTLHPALSVCSG